MRKTAKGTQKFTKEEKLSVIQEAGGNGVKVRLDNSDFYPAACNY